MSIYQQRRVVAVSSLVVFTLGTIARIQRGDDLTDSARFYIGVGVTYTFISIFTDLGLEVGAAFALLVMVAAFLREGDEVFKFAMKRSRKGGTKRGGRRNRSARRPPRDNLATQPGR